MKDDDKKTRPRSGRDSAQISGRDYGRRPGRRHGHSEYGQSWMLAAALLDGPRTFDDFVEYYRIMGRRFGVFVDLLDRSSNRFETTLERGLQVLLQRGWAVKENDAYHITDEGRREAGLMLADLERGGRFLEKATSPESVSRVTLIVHFVLAAIKLPAALISGSVGLLNDSLDTLMDGISSLFVFFGVRKGRERLVSYILLLFMTITGGYTLYEAVMRIIHPQPLSADWTAFVAVAVSAGLCALLWFYQKYAGLKHSCVPLIAQSIDSRNHIIVAGGVSAGLVATYFHFSLLDQIVGIVVAVLILKAAMELLFDLIRSSEDEEIDLSKYGFSRFETHQRRQMLRWFLFEIEKGRITSKEQLLHEARMSTDFSIIASFRALGIDCQPNQEEKLNRAVREIFEQGLAEELPIEGDEKKLRLTEAGEEELNRALANSWSIRPEYARDLPAGGTSRGASAASDRLRGSSHRRRIALNPRSARVLVFRILSYTLRLVFTAVLFTLTYALLRWLIGFLPVLDVWGPGASFGGASFAGASFGGAWISRTLTAGPFNFTPAQLLCMLCGVLFMYGGRLLMHPASHLIHHAR
ncbi:MAG: cation diffusion facilitator family transporter, partial [Sediminispirochaetaceae bacterium]